MDRRPGIMLGEAAPDLRAMRVFLTHVNEMPLETWVEAVRRRPLVESMEQAESELRLLERRLDHHGAVFETRDAVLAALWRFDCREGRHLTKSKSVTDHLRPATENAALAWLLHGMLRKEAFDALYQPFEPDIPRVLIEGLS